MFNPLCLFSEELLHALVGAGKKYFVRQTYERGIIFSENNTYRAFLITHYEKEAEALQHFIAIEKDAYRYLYDWENQMHRERLVKAVSQPDGYSVFASVVMPGMEKRAARLLKAKVKRYIDHYIKWFPAAKDAVVFDLYPQFGEVYVSMRFRKQEIKVSLAEVENFKSHVLRCQF